MHNETRQFAIGGAHYDGDRVTDSDGIGYIELRRPGSAEPVARINYHGPDAPMDVCTYGEPLPVVAVEWLIATAKEDLA